MDNETADKLIEELMNMKAKGKEKEKKQAEMKISSSSSQCQQNPHGKPFFPK